MKRTKRFNSRLLEAENGPVAGEESLNPASSAAEKTQAAPPVENVPDRPTTFQLAQLAAILATRPDSVRLPPAEVVLEALQVWDAAAKVNLSERQEREIWQAVFTDRTEEWEQRLSDYVGDEIRLRELLAEPRFDGEGEALAKLLKGSAASRRQEFEELIRYAKAHSLLPADGPEPSTWPPVSKVSGSFIRALVEAREQKAKSERQP